MYRSAARLLGIILLFLSVFTPFVYAAPISLTPPTPTPLPSGPPILSVTPDTIQIGDASQVEIDFPKPNAIDVYTLGLSTSNQISDIIPNSEISLTVDNSGRCLLNYQTGTTASSSMFYYQPTPSSTPVIGQCVGSGPFVFTTTLDTTRLGIPDGYSFSKSYHVILYRAPTSVVHSILFTVVPLLPFQYSVSPTNPKPGASVTITLSHMDNLGDYYYQLQNVSDDMHYKKCDGKDRTTATCVISFHIPEQVDPSNNPLQLLILDPTCDPNNTGCGNTIDINVDLSQASDGPVPPPPCAAPARVVNGPCDTLNTAIGDFATNPTGLLTDLMGFLLSISGGVAILIIIYAGYKMLTSAGNPEKIKGARDLLTSAIVGLLFLILSLVILEVIGVDILHIPGFQAT